MKTCYTRLSSVYIFQVCEKVATELSERTLKNSRGTKLLRVQHST